MTIVVGVAAPDGIILAGDSRSTILDGTHHRVASDNAIKIFSICDRIGVATYGNAFVGDRTIAGVMDEFVAQLKDPKTLPASDVAREVAEFFENLLAVAHPNVPPGEVALGFLVAGYDGDGIGRIFEVELPGRTVTERADTSGLGFAVRGMKEVADRMIYGIDWDLIDDMGLAVDPALAPELEKLRFKLSYPIAMQDAIDLAEFLVRTTIDMQRFSDGTVASPGAIPGCGGPVRLLAVTRQGTEWVADPALSIARPGIAEAG